MQPNERVFGKLVKAEDARNTGDALLQEQLMGADPDTGKVHTKRRQYLLIPSTDWALLRHRKHGRCLHLLTGSSSERLAVPFFDIDGTTSGDEDHRDPEAAETEMWQLVASIVEVGMRVFSSSEVRAVCCSMCRGDRLSCHVVLRGPKVAAVTTEEMGMMLAMAVADETADEALCYVTPDYNIYTQTSSLRAVGSVRSDGQGTKVPTHSLSVELCSGERQRTLLDTLLPGDPTGVADSDPIWGTPVTREEDPELCAAMERLRADVFSDKVDSDTQDRLRRLTRGSAPRPETNGTATRPLSRKPGAVAASNRGTHSRSRGVEVKVEGLDPQSMCLELVVKQLTAEFVRISGGGGGTFGKVGGTWEILVLPSGRPVFLQVMLNCPKSFNYCFAKGGSHENGRCPRIYVDLRAGTARSVCLYGKVCGLTRSVPLKLSTACIVNLVSVFRQRDESSVHFPDSADLVASLPVGAQSDDGHQTRHTLVWMAGRETCQLTKTTEKTVTGRQWSGSRPFNVSGLSGFGDNRAARGAEIAHLRELMSMVRPGKQQWVTVNLSASRYPVAINGDHVSAQLLACYDVLLGVGYNRGNVVIANVSVRSALSAMAAWADTLGTLRVVELPDTQLLTHTDGVSPIQGESMALVLERELVRYRTVAALLGKTTIHIAVCPAAAHQFLSRIRQEEGVDELVLVTTPGAFPWLQPTRTRTMAKLTRLTCTHGCVSDVLRDALRVESGKKRKRQTSGSVRVVVWDPAAWTPECMCAMIQVIDEMSGAPDAKVHGSLLYPGYASSSGGLASLILLHHPYDMVSYTMGPRDLQGEGDTAAEMHRQERENMAMAHFLIDPDHYLLELQECGRLDIVHHGKREANHRHPFRYDVVVPGKSPPAAHPGGHNQGNCPDSVLGTERDNVVSHVKKRESTIRLTVKDPRSAAYLLCVALWDILVGCPIGTVKVVVVIPEDCSVSHSRNMSSCLALRSVACMV